ncbi:Sodium/calcium exchanger protein-domain-containing protein [Lasiosphaeris hirsuta]|uniref:Sodium/calcium exchanger protein-domain-containing protein n=1 Tax=Lasiosphaeris hirsuta TaxID=260670 RepID=A0AA40BCN6_9PEZI|nr:Sodium/calcium exchanger protein-domain-containing protein [Lasiosphaeris hirsuta]
MPVSRSKRSRYSSRPFVVLILLLSILTTYAFVFQGLGTTGRRNHESRLASRDASEEDLDCRAVHRAADQCAFILANCEDDEAGLVHYLSFYYCTLGNVKPLAFVLMAIWLGLLFTTIGIAASDFFSINLSTIAKILGLSESLAGVTFLAFGNGSPDVFSTFAAMGSNSGSMAVGELIGAAGFITAVVAGSMALVREFKVSKRTFVRDIVFFIAAISFTMVFLADGELHLWECFTMVGFYLFYVVVVVGWHWFTVRRRRMRLRDSASRTHFHGATGPASDELEPYRDIPDDDDAAPVGARSISAPEPADISALERAPRIEVDGRGVISGSLDETDEERDNYIAAEVTSSMRVNRPRWGRSNTTITPIRPSLVGALEFRSVLSSLSKARNMHLGPLPERQYSDHASQLSGALQHTVSLYDTRGRPRTNTSPAHIPNSARERALSHGNSPLNLDHPGFARPELISEGSLLGSETRASSVARTVDGRLAPPSGSVSAADHTSAQRQSSKQSHKSLGLQLQIPSPPGGSSGRSSPSLSPFPGFTESPGILTPIGNHPDPSPYGFPTPLERRMPTMHGLEDDSGAPKPIRWWPYQLLPPPHVLLSTIFPTLQGWKEKSWWDKAMSLISVPSIFVLVTTLPVVETEHDEDDSEIDLAGVLEASQSSIAGLPISVQDSATIRPETEWQEFRRRTRSISSKSPRPMSPPLLALDSPHVDGEGPSTEAGHRPSIDILPHLARPNPPFEVDRTTASTEEVAGWNRWLVALQLFTGPFFVVLVGWANTYDDMENPRRMLLQLVLYSLVFSLCLLAALLLLTSPDQKPKYHFVLCFLGFVISVAWISTIAGEVVGVLKAFGVILGISEAILGLTIFAVGNSLGDLVADVTVARLGYPVMALAACFGGPMLNILLGVGIGGAWMGISSADKRHLKHPERPIHYKPYKIQVGGTLMISAISVLLTLIILLIAVPSNKWVMSRKIGWGLIGLWTVGTVINLVIELTGYWSDVS